ncbi:MAG TPA: hypothetical protein VKY44_08455 [Flavobacterium sp.]|nr:hypothetical protein [Flavobacterium sp.]
MKKLIIVLLFMNWAAFAQTQIKNCNENKGLPNAIVNNAVSGEWIGNTDVVGNIVIPETIKRIEVAHPDLGSIILDNQKGEICVDNEGEILNELVIETGTNLKKELLEILDNSYKVYKKDNKGKRFYDIDYQLSDKKGDKLETFNGILALGNLFNTSFNNYKLQWSKSIKDNKSYNKLPSYQYIAHTEEALFTDRKTYNKFKKYVADNDVQKIGNEYFISQGNSEHFVTLEINKEKQLVSKYTNTELFRDKKPYGFEKGDRVTMGKVEVNFDTANDYFVNNLSVQEKYLIDQKDYHSDCFIKQKKLNKEEQKNLDGKGIIGFATDYVNQLHSFRNSL